MQHQIQSLLMGCGILLRYANQVNNKIFIMNQEFSRISKNAITKDVHSSETTIQDN